MTYEHCKHIYNIDRGWYDMAYVIGNLQYYQYKVYLNHDMQQGSYQLNRINQYCEVWVGLILLDDGGTQRFSSTLYKHLYNKGQIHLSGCSFFRDKCSSLENSCPPERV